MKLAITSAVAFRGLPRDLSGALAMVERRAHWWQTQGAEGVVIADTLPGFYDFSIADYAEIRRVLADAGLSVPVVNAMRKSLHLPELVDADERRLAFCLKVCETLRADMIDFSICAPFPTGRAAQGWEEQPSLRGDDAPSEVFHEVATRLKSFARGCASAGMRLAVELHDDCIHDSAANCLRLLQLIDEPNVGVNPDLGNWYRAPYEQAETWREQIAQLAARTIYWEVKNYQRIIVPSHNRAYSWPTNIDAGDIDFREAAVILWRAGFRGWVCHEGGHGDAVASNTKYLAYFRAVLDQWIPMVTGREDGGTR